MLPFRSSNHISDISKPEIVKVKEYFGGTVKDNLGDLINISQLKKILNNCIEYVSKKKKVH